MIDIKQLETQFITNKKGKKCSVVLPIADFEELIYDMEDLAVVAERQNEPVTKQQEP